MPPLESEIPPDPFAPLVEIQTSAHLLAEGRVTEAVRRLEALSAAVPAYATSFVLLAKAYEAAQCREDALDAWHRAHFLVPGSPLVQRERRRLMDAQAGTSELALPTLSPPPSDTSDQGLEGDFSSEDPPPSDTAETVEVSTADESRALPSDGAKSLAHAELTPSAIDFEEPVAEEGLVDETPDNGEPFDSEDPFDAIPDDILPEVFVDDSDPISGALGIPAIDEMWDDDERDAAPQDLEDEGANGGESIASAPATADPWWKPSHGTGHHEHQEDAAAETGWTVVSEIETERTESALTEAHIAAPIQEPPDRKRGDAERTHSSSTDASIADDLDSLIRELEDAPRIRPDPNFIDEDEGFDGEAADEEADGMVSETLARIYVAQAQYGEAANVYDKLADQHPEQAAEFAGKAAEMRARLSGGG